mmetsp:Transcript_6476/g.12836  ORF Transcript_6476/g.12836 Transcript_6476/m.12836 type:complete len:144 (-) Transcript_6476:519-950(-)
MGDTGRAGQDLENLVQHAVEQGILDDQFIQLRNLQDDSNPDFVKDLIGLYYSDASGKINTIQQMLKGDAIDFQHLDAIVHQFKGSSASFGASEMTKTCIEFRDACQSNDAERCRYICGCMDTAYMRLQDILKEFERLEQLQKS